MAAVRLGLDEEGQPTLRKAGGPDARERLEREAVVLRAAAHPGVVDLLGVEDGQAGPTLVTRFVGGGTAADVLAGCPDPTLARLIAGRVATTLADLHDRDVAHGRVTPEHVLGAAQGAPVLCGLAEARLPGDSGGATPADDVAAVGALLARLLGDDRSNEAAALRAVAARANTPDPDVRLGMRALAHALSPPMVEERVEGHGRAVVPRRRSLTRRPAPVRVALAAAAVVVLAAAGTSLAAGPGPAARPAPGPPAAPAPPMAPSLAIASLPGGDLEVAGVRYRLGQPEDVVAVGDWDCDGLATPALLRTATGSVWVLAAWPGEGEEVEADDAGRAPGAASLVAADPDGDGCHALSVTDADGRPVPLLR